MEKLLIELKFEDIRSKTPIKIELTKNSIIHGFNGSGKTRILRTIFSFNDLKKRTSNIQIMELFSQLNIESLKINGYDYLTILNGQKEIRDDKYKSERNFVEEYSYIIKEIIEELDITIEKYESVLSPTVTSRAKKSSRDIKRINRAKSYLNDVVDTSRSIGRWIDETELLLKNISRNLSFSLRHDSFIERNEIFTFRELEFIHSKIKYLQEKFKEHTFDEDRKRELKFLEREEINNKIEKLKKDLLNYDSVLIDINRLNYDYVINDITIEIEKINNQIITDVWKDSKEVSNSYKRNLLEFKNKILKLNKIIKHYSNIQITNNENGIMFKKNGENIEFEKLSSGEKHILSLFIKIIFSKTKIILLDEPEISLSLNYQTKIVNDLFYAASDRILIVATHAPFIYDDFINYKNVNEIAIFEEK